MLIKLKIKLQHDRQKKIISLITLFISVSFDEHIEPLSLYHAVLYSSSTANKIIHYSNLK